VTASRAAAPTRTSCLGRIASSIAIVAACIPPLAIAFLVARHARNVMADARIGPFAP